MMTKKEALEILIKHTKRDCRGSGTGIRSLPSPMEIEKAKIAIKKVWNEVYDYPFNENSLGF